MNIIIVGYGRVGASMASILDTPENVVTVIDSDAAVLARIDANFSGRAVCGLGFDEDVLAKAGIDECDAFAAVTSSDNVNLMASEVARRLYGVQHVITRLVNPARLDVYRQLGLDFVCDTELVAEEISAKIRSHHANHLDTFGDYELMTFSLEADSPVQVRALEQIGDIEVLLVDHNGAVSKATPGQYLHPADTLMCLVHENTLAALAPYMRS